MFRGDFLGLQKRCGFETYTQSTTNLVLRNTWKSIVSLNFIAEIQIGEYWNKRILSMSFLYHVGSTTQFDISSSLTKFYCFNIQRGFSLPRNRCGFEFSTQYTTSHVLSNTSIIIPTSLQLLRYQSMNIETKEFC